MPLDKTDLTAGLVLTGRYKGQEHRVLVLGDASVGFGFELDGETVYKSLSSAGKAITHCAVNGWRFFSIAGSEPVTRPAKATRGKRTEDAPVAATET